MIYFTMAKYYNPNILKTFSGKTKIYFTIAKN